MALYQSLYSLGKKNTPTAETAGEEGIAVYDYTTTAALLLNDIVELGGIPAGATPTDVTLVTDDLDSGTGTLRFDVGVLSGAYQDSSQSRTIGAEFFSADATPANGGVARMTLKSGFNVAPDRSKDRGIGIKVQTAANVWANGNIKLILRYAYL